MIFASESDRADRSADVSAVSADMRDLVGASTSLNLRVRLDPASQELRHAPGLGTAAPRRKGHFGIEDFADRPETRLVQMSRQSIEKPSRGRHVVRIGFDPGIDKWTDEPGPYGPLMIGRVARPQIAVVRRLVVRIAGRQGTQP